MSTIRKISNIFLITILLACSTVMQPGVIRAETMDGTDSQESTDTSAEGSGEVTGGDADTQPELSGEVGMDTGTADTLKSEIMKSLVSFGGTGEPIAVQFDTDGEKKDHTKLFNEIVMAQLKLYELLYVTGIDAQLEAPATRISLGEGGELTNLPEYLTAFNIINSYVDAQLELLESEDEPNEDLIKALTSLKFDMKPFHDSTISGDSPIDTTNIRATIKGNIDKRTAVAIGEFLRYLNDGNGSDDISVLEKKDVIDSTKEVLGLIKQWGDLPHIKNATGDMKLTSIKDKNQEWLTALAAIVDSMETDTGGVTDKEDALEDSNTNPELATSAIGRMGSSLFTVKRSDHADDTPNKPLTNTLSWYIEGKDEKNSDETYDPGPAAKDDFLAMFAATAVYTPFVSKIGDKDYVEAYKALFGDTSDPIPDDDERVVFPESPLGPLDILSQVQNLRKPLYFYDDLTAIGGKSLYGSSTEDVKGVATLLTVGDLINTIEKKKELAAITVHGVLEKDGDAWAFYNYSLNKDGTVEATGSSDSDSEEESTPAPSSGGGKVNAGMPVLNKIAAEKTVNGGQDNTRVIFEMSFDQKQPGVSLLTGALMHNIYNDTLLKSRVSERANEAVYVDAIGNIVLNDGLVILPAAANPLYWAMPNHVDNIYGTNMWVYNPFTVAFMDTYPAIYQGGTSPSSVNEKKDKNKYLLGGYGESGNEFAVLPIKKGFKSTFTISGSGFLVRDFKMDGSTTGAEEQVKGLDSAIGVDDDESVADESWYQVATTYPMQMQDIATQSGDSLFPYLNTKIVDPMGQEGFDTDNINFKSSILIAKNMYAFIIGEERDPGHTSAADGRSTGGSSIGGLREGFLFVNVTMPVLTGITNGIEFDKTNAKSDLLRAGGDANVFQKWVLNFSKWIATTVAHSDNILSISNADEVSLLKGLYGVFIEYGYYIVFLFIIILIIIFLREGDFMAAALKGFIIAALLFISFFLVPLLVPWSTNLLSEPMTKKPVLNSMMSKLELVDKIHEPTAAGQSGLSVKLYNMSPKQAKEINEQYRYDGNYLTNKFSINDNLGMFVQGTELRLDLYTFWRFDPLIIATSDDVANPNTEVDPSVPQIYHSDHSVSKFMAGNEQAKTEMAYNNDLVDYYMPFNLLENGLMKTLNTYLVYYKPPQSIVRYPDGLVKSSYILNTYMKSLAFLAGEPNVAELIASAENEEEYAHLGLNAIEVEVVNQNFYPYGDVLNLQSWVDSELEDLPQTYANSLWIQSMIKSGYYSPGTGIEKRLALADKVNRKAYDIIIEMQETKGMVSDETLVKLIAMYTTFEWNKEISYINNNVFPKTVALNEVSAADLVSSTVLGQSDQFLYYDTSVIENVYTKNGIMGIIFIDIAFLALAIYSILLSWVLPIIIVGIIFYAIYLVLTNRKMMPALIFVFKLVGLAMLMNLGLVIVIATYQMHTNLFLFALLLLVVDGLFLWLYWKQFFGKKNAFERSWQHKHLKQMGGSGLQDAPQGSGGMQTYLTESEGVYGRRSSHEDRYGG